MFSNYDSWYNGVGKITFKIFYYNKMNDLKSIRLLSIGFLIYYSILVFLNIIIYFSKRKPCCYYLFLFKLYQIFKQYHPNIFFIQLFGEKNK